MSSPKETTTSTIQLNTASSSSSHATNENHEVFVFDSNLLEKQGSHEMPKEFVWPSEELAKRSQGDLNEPLIDLAIMKKGDDEAIASAAKLVRKACSSHGFFQVINHGVDKDVIDAAERQMESIFKLPISKKLVAVRKRGEVSGYSGAHADRYCSRLPWKETFSFKYNHRSNSKSHQNQNQIVEYFKCVLGHDFQHTGHVYQKYCEAMMELSLVIMELLAISLGLDRFNYRRFFQDGDSIMRCNYYPPCKNPSHTFGTGPHTDPTSLTILHQDQVGGLEVFADDKWLAIRPRPEALVINIGDTFTALSNGKYKSCLHRALVNAKRERKSLAFFLCPREDKTVRPPDNLLSTREPRKFPDFTWANLLEFTQKHYRADDSGSTLQSFIHWHCYSNSPNS